MSPWWKKKKRWKKWFTDYGITTVDRKMCVGRDEEDAWWTCRSRFEACIGSKARHHKVIFPIIVMSVSLVFLTCNILRITSYMIFLTHIWSISFFQKSISELCSSRLCSDLVLMNRITIAAIVWTEFGQIPIKGTKFVGGLVRKRLLDRKCVLSITNKGNRRWKQAKLALWELVGKIQNTSRQEYKVCKL